MGLFDKFFQKKESAVGSKISFNRMGRPIWTKRNYAKLADEAYVRNVVAYRCVRLIAENIAAIPIQAFVRDREVLDHPAIKLLSRPNPTQSKATFIEAIISFWRLSGNGYIEGSMLRGEMRELHVLRPDRMKAIPNARGGIARWRYSVGGSYYDFEMEVLSSKQQPVLHLKDFHPIDDWYGLSPVEAGAYSIDVHNAASGFNKSLLDNQASPSGAFVVEDGKDGPGELTKSQYERLRDEMDEKYGGMKNAGRPMLLEGGLKWQAMGFSPKDLNYTEGKNQVAREIALAFGVPPLILGIPGDNTFANYREANEALHLQTILPLLGKLLEEIANFLKPTMGDFDLRYDIDKVEALAHRREKAWDRVKNADFLTDDEKRALLGYPPYKAGSSPTERIYVNGGKQPIEDIVDPPEGDPNAGGNEPDPDDLDDDD